jgi:hypothetical protein
MDMGQDRCDTLEVIEHDAGLIGRCACGWESMPAGRGRDVGEQWAAHRSRGADAARVA